jgi:hypothetical protein
MIIQGGNVKVKIVMRMKAEMHLDLTLKLLAPIF